MPSYIKINLSDVKDRAPDYGMAEFGEARFARQTLGAEHIGLAHYKINPGQRIGFGHRHGEAEEVYVVVAGSGRFRADDDVFDVTRQDVVYCPPSVARAWEAGGDGMEMLAFGSHVEGEQTEMLQGWWAD